MVAWWIKRRWSDRTKGRGTDRNYLTLGSTRTAARNMAHLLHDAVTLALTPTAPLRAGLPAAEDEIRGVPDRDRGRHCAAPGLCSRSACGRGVVLPGRGRFVEIPGAVWLTFGLAFLVVATAWDAASGGCDEPPMCSSRPAWNSRENIERLKETQPLPPSHRELFCGAEDPVYFIQELSLEPRIEIPVTRAPMPKTESEITGLTVGGEQDMNQQRTPSRQAGTSADAADQRSGTVRDVGAKANRIRWKTLVHTSANTRGSVPRGSP